MRRARAEAASGESAAEPTALVAPAVSSIIPRPMWALSLMVGCGLLAWASVIGVGVWLDLQEIDPWRDIFGLESGRFLRFWNSTVLLTCSQLSFLILWRRSRSRKDFSGQYRVWFWVGAVCSIYCVATVTRFHERWSSALASGSNLVWLDAETVCWMVPATTLLLSAIHLMRRDMPLRSASRQWVRVSRALAVAAGLNLLMGSLVWPKTWFLPISEALCSLWPTVFASSLLIHARFVTYVTNEATRESKQPRQPSRWEARVKAFARHVALMASEEWQIQRAKRTAAKAAKLAKQLPHEAELSGTPDRPEAKPQTVAKRRPVANRKSVDAPSDETPVTKAVNLRPISHPTEAPVADDPAAMQSIHIHPPQPIPPPHFEIVDNSLAPQADLAGREENETTAVAESDLENASSTIPAGYTPERWKSLSKKERKRVLRAESSR
ncbi:MAG: hypothetical protein U0929_10865 [Planctomycetaceae bacterium]